MADQNKKNRSPATTPKMQNWKPGSEPDKAKAVSSDGDFGVPAGSGPNAARDYASKNTKRRDPGATPPYVGPEAANNPDAEEDDSFAGEISAGEALGQDLPLPPSSDTQGLSEESSASYPLTDDPDDGELDSSRLDRR